MSNFSPLKDIEFPFSEAIASHDWDLHSSLNLFSSEAMASTPPAAAAPPPDQISPPLPMTVCDRMIVFKVRHLGIL